VSRDWYKDHPLSPECYPDSEYLGWAQDNGLYVDAAGNVDYGPPDKAYPIADEDVTFEGDDGPGGLDSWDW
jgi:hypothetical protein